MHVPVYNVYTFRLTKSSKYIMEQAIEYIDEHEREWERWESCTCCKVLNMAMQIETSSPCK